MARAMNAGSSSTSQPTKSITIEEAARITWAKLPSVKVEPVVLEPKLLFEISGGGNRANR
jgi:hypothetical protein